MHAKRNDRLKWDWCSTCLKMWKPLNPITQICCKWMDKFVWESDRSVEAEQKKLPFKQLNYQLPMIFSSLYKRTKSSPISRKDNIYTLYYCSTPQCLRLEECNTGILIYNSPRNMPRSNSTAWHLIRVWEECNKGILIYNSLRNMPRSNSRIWHLITTYTKSRKIYRKALQWDSKQTT